jgi:hypothetical protein
VIVIVEVVVAEDNSSGKAIAFYHNLLIIRYEIGILSRFGRLAEGFGFMRGDSSIRRKALGFSKGPRRLDALQED